MAYFFRKRWIFKFYKNKLFSSKIQTHYENLEINPKATQGEIKSAYFKLSMQYHPDKNSSEEAKIKFRNISEAYEVLGNYDKRKKYDRTIRVQSPIYQQRQNIKPTDITKEAHRAHMEIMRHKTQNDGIPIYDFDAWTRAHYKKIFNKTRQTKMNYEQYIEYKEEIKISVSQGAESVFLTVLFIAIFTILIFSLLLISNESYELDNCIKKNDKKNNDSLIKRSDST